jgi:hypothetical protein
VGDHGHIAGDCAHLCRAPAPMLRVICGGRGHKNPFASRFASFGVGGRARSSAPGEAHRSRQPE